MKRKAKRMLSVIIAFAMVMMLGVMSVAATYDITIKKTTGDNAAHTYTAYQVFSGNKTETSTGSGVYTLTGIDWGTGVDSSGLLNDLQAIEIGSPAKKPFETCASAADVAGVLSSDPSNTELITAFENAVAENLATGYSASASATDTTATITVPGYGYYFIKDTVATGSEGAASKFMLKVVDIHTTATIDAKEVLPSITKKIVEGSDEVDANTASVGDTVSFKIGSKVPDLTDKGYERYWFVINDVLCKGLTYTDNSLVIKIGSKTLTSSEYTLTKTTDSSTGKTSLEIAIKDFLSNYGTSATYIGKDITVTYDATLNENCDVTTNGNPNTAQLVYSNDPSQNYDGDKPSDNPNAVVGNGPIQITRTYTTGIKIIKIDHDTRNRLPGATFEIIMTGVSTNKVIVEKEVFSLDNTNGTYYKLKNGTYTTTEPTITTSGEYESITEKYTKEIVRTVETGAGTEITMTAQVDNQGYLVFEGLGEGTYKISEKTAPTGYIKSNVVHTVVISTDPDPEVDNKPNWKYEVDGTPVTGAEVVLTFENTKLNDLPETGGSGTALFYVAGGILTLAGIALFTVKKIKTSEE